MSQDILRAVGTKGTTMFNTIRRWIFWWKRSKQAKKALKAQIEMCKKMGPAQPPTQEEVEKFMKEFDMGWDSHMVTKVETRRTYFEQDLKVNYDN